MTKRQSGRTRNEYIQLIGEYTRRANKYPKGSPKRLKLSRQIAMMRYRMKQVQQKYRYTKVNGKYMELPPIIHETAARVKDIYGVDLRASLSINKPNYGYTTLHYCFCKYLIEQGCKSRQISFFMGTNREKAASVARKKFTSSFLKNQNNRNAYHEFIKWTRRK